MHVYLSLVGCLQTIILKIKLGLLASSVKNNTANGLMIYHHTVHVFPKIESPLTFLFWFVDWLVRFHKKKSQRIRAEEEPSPTDILY